MFNLKDFKVGDVVEITDRWYVIIKNHNDELIGLNNNGWETISILSRDCLNVFRERNAHIYGIGLMISNAKNGTSNYKKIYSYDVQKIDEKINKLKEDIKKLEEKKLDYENKGENHG